MNRRPGPTRDDASPAAQTARARAHREMLILATGLSVFHGAMFLIGTWWSFTAGLVLISLAGWRDRRVRPDAADIPLVVYVCVFLFCAALIAGVLAGAGVLAWTVLR